MDLAVKEVCRLIREDGRYDHFLEIFDESFIEQFVRGKKHNNRMAYECLRNYLHKRSVQYAKLTMMMNPTATPMYRNGCFQILKSYDDEGRVVALSRGGLWDPVVVPVDEGICEILSIVDEFLHSVPATCDQGVVLICDCKGSSLRQIMQLTPSVVYKILALVHGSTPFRFKAMHLVNAGFIWSTVVNTLRFLVPLKTKKRIYTHGTLESLHKHVPPAILPASLGGMVEEDEAIDFDLEKRIHSREQFYENFKCLLQQ